MAKNKTDYVRMIQMGEWLESFIDPDISYWQFKQLTTDAISILNIDFLIEETDLTLETIKIIDTLPIDLKGKYLDPCSNESKFIFQGLVWVDFVDFPSELMKDKNWDDELKPVVDAVEVFQEEYDTCVNSALEIATKLSGKSKEYYLVLQPSSQIEAGIEKINLYLPTFEEKQLQSNNELRDIIVRYKEIEKTYDYIQLTQWPDTIKSRLFIVYQLRPVVKILLSEISNSSKHWADCLAFIEQDVDSHTKLLMMRYGIHSIKHFENQYSELVERLSHKDGTIKVIRHFSQVYRDCCIEHLPTIFPWKVIVSRIFYDFFMLGGQDYINICQQCGRFNITHRKGRKKFCSDGCRLDHFREKKSTHIS